MNFVKIQSNNNINKKFKKKKEERKDLLIHILLKY